MHDPERLIVGDQPIIGSNGLVMRQIGFAVHVADRLGVSDLDIQWRRSSSPGGDSLNIAHVHAEDDLRAFVIEHDLPDPLDRDARRAVIHELLHVALRHVAAVAGQEQAG